MDCGMVYRVHVIDLFFWFYHWHPSFSFSVSESMGKGELAVVSHIVCGRSGRRLFQLCPYSKCPITRRDFHVM